MTSPRQPDRRRQIYALSKLSQAVRTLVKDPGSIKLRLYQAWLIFHPVLDEDFPSQLRAQWRQIDEDLTSRQAKDPTVGRLRATLATMRLKKASALAEKIMDLRDDLAEHINQIQTKSTGAARRRSK